MTGAQNVEKAFPVFMAARASRPIWRPTSFQRLRLKLIPGFKEQIAAENCRSVLRSQFLWIIFPPYTRAIQHAYPEKHCQRSAKPCQTVRSSCPSCPMAKSHAAQVLLWLETETSWSPCCGLIAHQRKLRTTSCSVASPGTWSPWRHQTYDWHRMARPNQKETQCGLRPLVSFSIL